MPDWRNSFITGPLGTLVRIREFSDPAFSKIVDHDKILASIFPVFAVANATLLDHNQCGCHQIKTRLLDSE
jgi:hypothetical protein